MTKTEEQEDLEERKEEEENAEGKHLQLMPSTKI